MSCRDPVTAGHLYLIGTTAEWRGFLRIGACSSVRNSLDCEWVRIDLTYLFCVICRAVVFSSNTGVSSNGTSIQVQPKPVPH